ncbi:hypothetical protein EXIGLDRAFT_699209 [Exidia glandulosa HHB12029]|uniref:Uncharacterized protein n=1 Tax=Exidia glandulosa HHB12029 TaxID=1314781 RepID=A0A165QAP7_EXIGL|nr:hypothetical protein EXIGLDRAFT_699209 [Exidia glandulosa HHB12029]
MTSRLPVRSSGHKRTPFTKRQTACTTASLYKAPLAGAVVDSAQPLTVSWDTTCFNNNPEKVDLRLYSETTRLQIWKELPYAAGSYNVRQVLVVATAITRSTLPQVELFPRWWNDTETVKLKFSIQASGNPFASDYGPGPVFTATYTAPTDGSVDDKADMSIIDTGYTWVKNFVKSLSGGEIAAAIICPLLFIAIVIGVFFYVRRSRKQVEERHKRFSAMVDKRMSTISGNWASMSAAGAQYAIRNSMATFGRPSADMATVGHESAAPGSTVGSGLRPQTRARSGTRVSFAPESMYGRPSNAGETVRSSVYSTGPTRSFHYGDAPPMPQRNNSGSPDNLTLSPTQQTGAFTLSAYEIDNRASQYDAAGDVMPALAMMRQSNDTNELMFSPTKETPLPPVPAVTAQAPKSPLGMMPMMDSNLSPEERLRQYAAGKKQSISVASPNSASFFSPVTPTFPSPAAQRTVYSANGSEKNPFRKSVAHAEDDGAYDGVDHF